MLNKGCTLSTETNKAYTVDHGLPPGGQGSVFLLKDQLLVAKVYHQNLLNNDRLKKQRQHLQDMIQAGAPSKVFVWPTEIIEKPSLGYIMARVPDNYLKLEKLNWEPSAANLKTRLRICYRLVESFSILHNRKGYAYCDLSPGNVLCETNSGNIHIIDNDNLTVNGVSSPMDIRGTHKYMAPELETGKIKKPNIDTDLHSLPVIIFETLLLHHPLLGNRVIEGPPELEDEALGAKPNYIYHPSNRSNRYTKYTEYGGVPIDSIPESLRNLFIESFVQGITNPIYRVRESRWRRALANTLDTLIKCNNSACPFKFSYLTKLNQDTCGWCSSRIDKGRIRLLKFVDRRCKTQRYKIVCKGDWLAAHHCKVNQEFNYSPSDVCAHIIDDHFHGLMLRNVSKEPFLYQPSGQEARVLPPQTSVPLNVGCRVEFGADGTLAEVMNYGI